MTTVVDRLVESVTNGTVLDLTDEDERTVPADVIRHILRGKLAPDPDPHGLRLRGAVIEGRLDLQNVVTSVWLDLRTCELPEGIDARDAQLTGLGLSGCHIEHRDKPAVDLAGLTISSLSLEGATVTGHCDEGAVVLTGARIDGAVTLRDAHIRNDRGSAVQAERAHIGQTMFLDRLDAEGVGTAGTVRLLRARVGMLRARAARLRNASGPALFGDRMDVSGDLFLHNGFEATGTGETGAVRLLGAHVGGSASFGASRMVNESGPALDLEAVSVDHVLYLDDGFDAQGAGPLGAVRLVDAHVGGSLLGANAEVHNDNGPALHAALARFGQNVFLRNGFRASGSDVDGAVNLVAVRIGGRLMCETAGIRTNGPGVTLNLYDTQVASEMTLVVEPDDTVNVEGLTYAGLPRKTSSREWLRIIRDRTPWYSAQPYQQLAAAHRAAGHDGEARRVLMAQRRDQIDRRALTGRLERTWARFTGLTLGYGYQPWRALIALAAVVAVAVALSVAVGDCRMVDRIGVGLNMGAPLITTGAKCTTTSPDLLTVAGWFLKSLGWAFATLFVAGFTGVVRKS